MIDRSSSIYVAGHRGLVGSALVQRLREDGFTNLVLKTRDALDLREQAAVNHFFADQKIDYIFIAAARVGGISTNSLHQADFLYDNLMIAANVIHAAAQHGVTKLLFLGSSCIYPRLAPQPMPESSLLTGAMEPTNEGYAIAKIAGLKLCEMYQRQYGKRFISAMPANLYGPGDDFHPTDSHVIPGMMRRFHEAKVAGAKSVVVWGTGTARREFLHADDLAAALVLLMETYESDQPINVGSGEEVTIEELAMMMKDVTGLPGSIDFDRSKPDGMPRKLLDSTRIRELGWKPTRSLMEGMSEVYERAVQSGLLPVSLDEH